MRVLSAAHEDAFVNKLMKEPAQLLKRNPTVEEEVWCILRQPSQAVTTAMRLEAIRRLSVSLVAGKSSVSPQKRVSADSLQELPTNRLALSKAGLRIWTPPFIRDHDSHAAIWPTHPETCAWFSILTQALSFASVNGAFSYPWQQRLLGSPASLTRKAAVLALFHVHVDCGDEDRESTAAWVSQQIQGNQ